LGLGSPQGVSSVIKEAFTDDVDSIQWDGHVQFPLVAHCAELRDIALKVEGGEVSDNLQEILDPLFFRQREGLGNDEDGVLAR